MERALAKKIINKVAERHGLQVTRYSGRGMMGAECLAVVVETEEDLKRFRSVPAPSVDSLGRGLIAYWSWITVETDADLA